MNVIAGVMRSYIPNIKKSQKTEVIDYMYDMTEEKEQSDANLIAFNNGIYDLVTGELKPFSTDIVITNKIPWDYKPDAYSKLADSTLNKLACGDAAIRALLEECIGYCFYRRNELGKAFILTGDKSNGKSTFLDCVKAILGDRNISALDLKELGGTAVRINIKNIHLSGKNRGAFLCPVPPVNPAGRKRHGPLL